MFEFVQYKKNPKLNDTSTDISSKYAHCMGAKA